MIIGKPTYQHLPMDNGGITITDCNCTQVFSLGIRVTAQAQKIREEEGSGCVQSMYPGMSLTDAAITSKQSRDATCLYLSSPMTLKLGDSGKKLQRKHREC